MASVPRGTRTERPDGLSTAGAPFSADQRLEKRCDMNEGSGSLEFVVQGAPVPLERARVGRWGGRTPHRSRAWKGLVRAAAMAVSVTESWPPATQEVAVDIVVYRAARRGDIDNFAKAVLDACNGVLWADDRVVGVLRVALDDRHRDNPGVYVRVTRL